MLLFPILLYCLHFLLPCWPLLLSYPTVTFEKPYHYIYQQFTLSCSYVTLTYLYTSMHLCYPVTRPMLLYCVALALMIFCLHFCITLSLRLCYSAFTFVSLPLFYASLPSSYVDLPLLLCFSAISFVPHCPCSYASLSPLLCHTALAHMLPSHFCWPAIVFSLLYLHF